MKTSSPNQGRFLILFLALAGIAAVLWAMAHYTGVAVHPYLLVGFRWAAIVAAVPVIAFYVFIVFFTQYTSYLGPASILEQHAFLVPVPFFGL